MKTSKIVITALLIGTAFQGIKAFASDPDIAVIIKDDCTSAIIKQEDCVSITDHGPRFRLRR
jgi:hypothetical protein